VPIALDRGKAPPQCALDLVDLVVHLRHGSAGSTRRWKFTISPSSASRTRTSCTSPTGATFVAISQQRRPPRRCARSSLAAASVIGLQGLDVGLNLDAVRARRGSPLRGRWRRRAAASASAPSASRSGGAAGRPSIVRTVTWRGERAVAGDHHDAPSTVVIERAARW
jgi:hypothetical protein